ncbi:MAG: radical SAM protein [Candidatus Hodarchaeota archaeon]
MILSPLKQISDDPSYILSLEREVIDKLTVHAFEQRKSRFGNYLECFAPMFDLAPYKIDTFTPSGIKRFAGISITGDDCTLQCDHCKGYLLKGMQHASRSTFVQVLSSLIDGGASGFLISGGADKDGKVPIKGFIGTIKDLKKKENVRIVIHSGLLSRDELHKLEDAGVDGIMFDLVGSESTLRDVCHLDAKPLDYYEMISAAKEMGLPVMPHVVVGLDHGRITGEFEVLKVLKDNPPDALVLVVLMPFPGTPMENVKPPAIEAVKRYALASRLLLPGIPLVLGCARPQGIYKVELEKSVVSYGLNGIAYPVQETLDHAKEKGLRVRFHEECCSLITRQV